MTKTTDATLWIKNPLAIYSNQSNSSSPSNCEGGLVIRGNKIVELVTKNQQPITPIDTTFDASRLVVLPGLINTHHHFYQTLTRAFPTALDKPLFPWLKSLYPVWAGLRPEQIHWSSRLALAELLLSGCTTAADHHYLFPQGLENAVDIQVDAAKELGIRMTVTRGSMCLGEDEGGLPPRTTIQTEQAIIDDSERVIKEFHDPEAGAMIQIALAPCSPFSVTPEVMKASAALAQKHNVHLHTHLAETHDETDFCRERFGLRPLDYLESVGWMNNKTWLAHGIHFDQEEIERLGKDGVGISHCPSSNMILASGICQASALEDAGSPLGLGVDGSASNDGSNMIQEVRMAFLLQRLKDGAENVSHLDALRWATQGSAGCLGRSDVGDIAVGMQADLALYNLDEARFSGHGDPLAALILCGAHKADHVMVGGQWRVKDGVIPELDMDELLHEHKQSAKQLAQRYFE
ncbi:MAG: 8-oxoguanine deaminase [Cellvibrionaceae bacterium]|nr:8-oxoguanine deaminase [Cellvibrionaceae bacterium]|tara:strand:- start:2614 stop:4002 length:1389 start_codon:yes stop_codon:yes gene_type:complete